MSSGYRVSPARIAAVAFTVFVLVFAHGAYITYCVLPRIYEATAKIEITPSHPPDSGSYQNDFEFITSPDVLSPIITDLQLDKIWAKHLKLVIDQMPMQDALEYLNKNLRLDWASRNSNIIAITVSSEVPKEASDIANAIADRYQYERGNDADQAFKYRQHDLNDEIAQQKKIVAGKASAVDRLRAQLEIMGIHLGPGVAGLIAADLAAQKSGASAQIDALAPLRAAQAELDAQQRALDDFQLRLRQAQSYRRLAPDPVKILSLADPPERPALPDVGYNLSRAAMEAAALAVAAAVLLELAMWYYLPHRPAPPQASHPTPPGLASADY